MKETIKCCICGKALENDTVYQLRYGYIDNNNFFPEEDIGCYCIGCAPSSSPEEKEEEK